MASSLASLVVNLQVESAELRKGLDAAKAEIDKFKKHAHDGFTVLKGALAGLAKDGIDLVLRSLKDSVSAYIESDKSFRQLSAVAGENAAAFAAQADAMRESLGVDDEQIQNMQMLAIRYGVNQSQIEKLTLAVLDYAAITGDGATESMTKMLRAIENGGKGLGKLGLAYESTGDSAKDLDLLVEKLNSRFAGGAQTNAESFGGKLEIMKGHVETLAETFGELVASIDKSIGAVQFLSEAFKGLNIVIGGDKENEERAKRTAEATWALEEFHKAQAEVLNEQANLAFAISSKNDDAAEQARRNLKYLLEDLETWRKAAEKASKTALRPLTEVTPTKTKSHEVGKAGAGSPVGADVIDWEGFKRLWNEAVKLRRDTEEWLKDKEIEDVRAVHKQWRAEFLRSITYAAELWERLMGNVPGRIGQLSVAIADEQKKAEYERQMDEYLGKGSIGAVLSQMQAEILESSKTAGKSISNGFAMAATIITGAAMNAAPKFSAALQGAMQGAQAGGGWGAVIGAIAGLLTQMKSFMDIIAAVEEGLGMVMEALEPIIKPLVMLSRFANLFGSIIMKQINPILELLVPVLNWFAIGILDVVWAIIKGLLELWDGVVVALAQIAYAFGLNDLGNWIQELYVQMAPLDKAVGELKGSLVDGAGAFEALGTGTTIVDDHNDALAEGTSALNKFTESVTNVPTGWKVEAARFDAQKAPGSGGGGARTMPPLYLADDIVNVIDGAGRQMRFRRSGSPI